MTRQPLPHCCLLLDWGDTVMRVLPDCQGPMCTWPRVELIPGVRDALEEVHGSHAIALATNAADSNEDDVRQALDRVHLASLFDRVYCFRTVGHRKPSQPFFQHVLDDLCMDPPRVIMVGDDFEADVRGANVAGLYAIWFNERTREERTGPMHRTIHSFSCLPGAVRSRS